MKRTDYISWHEFFMSMAQLASMRSKDPSTQVGACIVDSNNRVLSVGYNGFPNRCHDDSLPWSREGGFLDSKYAYVVHAELNAIMNGNRNDLKGATMYVTLCPCNECAKAIVQAGISKVLYLDDKYKDADYHKAARRIFDLAGVHCDQIKLDRKKIEISLEQNE